jgi:putative aminopeptidase FrvX
MIRDSYDFLEDLLTTPSPSGFEQPVQRAVRKRMGKYADEIASDLHGNLICCFNPGAKIKVMLAGHCDQIGMMVTHIDDQGYIWINQIGGIDVSVCPGSVVKILTENGEITGVMGARSLHLTAGGDRGKPLELRQLWIDIGAKDGAEVRKIVKIGDPIVYDLKVTKLAGDRVASPAMDDKVGVFVVMEAMRLIAKKIGRKKKTFPVALYAVSTVQEEVGLRGAKTASFGIDPMVGIAVDVTHASDAPMIDPKQTGTLKMGQGPVVFRGSNINPIVENLLTSTAKKKKIPYQPIGAPNATGTDANAIQVSRAGVAAALIGIPNRYMHTQVEVVDLKDLENAAKLLAESILAIRSNSNFTPK